MIMNFFKYFTNSQIILRFDINIFNIQNYIIPKFCYTGPDTPYDRYHYTFGVILPFLQILCDFDSETESDKLAIFKNRIIEDEEGNPISPDLFES